MIAHPFLKKLSAFLFGLFLSLVFISYSMSNFTSYEIVQPAFTKTISGQLGGQIDAGQLKSTLLLQCATKSTVDLPLQNQKISVKCSDLNKPGADINKLAAKALFDNSYYKKYNCNFISCIQQEIAQGISPSLVFLLISEKAHEFYNLLLVLSIVLTIGFALFMLELEQTLIERLKSLGWPFLFTGSSYLYVLFRGRAGAAAFVDQVFDRLSPIYLTLLITGVVLLAYGYWLQYQENKLPGPAKTAL